MDKENHPLRKLLYEGEPYLKIDGGIIPPDEPEKFVYVFGQKQRFNIKGYSVNVYGFAGVTAKGAVTALPLFFYAGLPEDAPWESIIRDISAYGDFDVFILSEYGDEIKNALAKVKPDARFYTIIHSVPPEFALKREVETIFGEFEKKFKFFWWKCGAIDVEEITISETIAQTCIKTLIEFFKGKIYLKAVEIDGGTEPPPPPPTPPPIGGNPPPQPPLPPRPQKPQEEPLREEKPQAADPVKDSIAETIKLVSPIAKERTVWREQDGTVYCFVLEKTYYIGGARQRLGVFTKITNERFEKTVLIDMPENIKNADWEEVIPKAAEKIGPIKYILFRGCNLYIPNINTEVLPNAVWCGTIADIPTSEKSRDEALKRFNDIENHLTGESLSPEAMKAHLLKIGIADVELI